MLVLKHNGIYFASVVNQKSLLCWPSVAMIEKRGGSVLLGDVRHDLGALGKIKGHESTSKRIEKRIAKKNET